MKRQTKVRMCFAVLVLVSSLGFMPEPAYALPCCDQACNYIYDKCVNGLIYPACAGDPACCENKETVCFSHCKPYC